MTDNLTKPMSKKSWAAIFIVTFGAEILLYLNRYLSLAGTVYDAVMVSSLFIGWKLAPMLTPEETVPKKPKLLKWIQYTGAFLFFFLGSSIINIYSNMTFRDFTVDYDKYVQSYTFIQTDNSSQNSTEIVSPSLPVSTLAENIDTIGSDLYTDALAGFEEVWRLAYIIMILFVCKKIFSRRWESGRRDVFLLTALFLSSFLFGVDHTLDTAEPLSIKIGSIVTFADMGLLFGIILLWTRSLWLAVMIHAIYDMTATLSWYYIDYAVELFAVVVFIVFVILLLVEKTHQIQRRYEREAMDGEHMDG